MSAAAPVASSERITISSDTIEVVVDPRVGGSIISIRHRILGLSVLGTVPWEAVEAPVDSLAARDEPEWLTRFTGGWPVLFPNGGDACTVDGVFHGFHGEGSIAPWSAQTNARAIVLTRDFVTAPVSMTRSISIAGEVVTVDDSLRVTGGAGMEVMWGHHPTFGSDLLVGPIEITTGARRATVDELYDPPANPLAPGASGAWPTVAGKDGDFDLEHPPATMASLVYLDDFAAPFMAIRRLDDAVAAVLSFDTDRFPCAWLRFELEGNRDPPWKGKARLIGMEPNTTRSAMGIVDARKRGSALLTLTPGMELATQLRLHVFKPTGRIVGIDAEGHGVAG